MPNDANPYKTENKITVQLTQADMQRAMAHWLSEVVLKDPVEVTLVRLQRDRMQGAVEHFEVDLMRIRDAEESN